MIVATVQYPKKEKSFVERLAETSSSDRYKIVREIYYNPERTWGSFEDYYFPEFHTLHTTGDDVPGEIILSKDERTKTKELEEYLSALSTEELEYYNECLRFIIEQSTVPTEDEIAIGRKIVHKNCKGLSPGEDLVYNKYRSRFYESPVGFQFDVLPISIINPFSKANTPKEIEEAKTMINHYFDPYTVRQIQNVLEIFEDHSKENPDMTKEPFKVVIAVAHCYRVTSIRDYDYIKSIMNYNAVLYTSDFVTDNLYDSDVQEFDEDFTELLEDHYCEFSPDPDYETNFIITLQTDTDTHINLYDMPYDKNLLVVESMSRNNKFGLTINASRYTELDDAVGDTVLNLKETFNAYVASHLGI